MAKITKILNKIFCCLLIAYALLGWKSQYLAISVSDKEVLSAMNDNFNWYYKDKEFASYFFRVLDDNTKCNKVLSETRFIYTPEGFMVSQPIHRYFW